MTFFTESPPVFFGSSKSFAEARFRTGCRTPTLLPLLSFVSDLSTTYRVADGSVTMIPASGVSQPFGATGLIMPQAPKPASTTTAMTMPGTACFSGRGALSTDPLGSGLRKAATVRLRAKL